MLGECLLCSSLHGRVCFISQQMILISHEWGMSWKIPSDLIPKETHEMVFNHLRFLSYQKMVSSSSHPRQLPTKLTQLGTFN